MKLLLILTLLFSGLIAEEYKNSFIKAECDIIISTEFDTCYNAKLNGANFVYFKITGKSYSYKKPAFKYNPALSKQIQASPYEYAKKGYDRGHLFSRRSASFSKSVVTESFYMTNITPQKPYFNRYIWYFTEKMERKLAKIYNKVEVIAGVIYSKNELNKNSIHIPSYFYKIIYIPSENKIISYLFPAEADYKSYFEIPLYRISTKELIKKINMTSNILIRLNFDNL